jgi:hypothetical protein
LASVWFRPQAVWVSGSTDFKMARSMWADIRLLPVDAFIAAIWAAIS